MHTADSTQESPLGVPNTSQEGNEEAGEKKQKRSSTPKKLGKNHLPKNKKRKIKCQLVLAEQQIIPERNERLVQPLISFWNDLLFC